MEEIRSQSGKSVRKSADGKSIRSREVSERSADGKSIRRRNAGVRPKEGKSARNRSARGRSGRTVDDERTSRTRTEGRSPDGKSINQGSHRGRKKRKKQKNSLLTNIILIVAAAVFCVSAFQLIKIGKGYYDGRSEYEKIRELAIKEDKKEGTGFQVNFDELRALNPDTIAWLRFDPEPAVINYPVVQGKDNEEYLHKTFSANENTLGTIFLNVDNNANFLDENSLLYGHYMNDGSMFRHLEDYKDKAFWEANPYFYIYTPDGQELVYHIYSVGEVLDTADTYLTDFPTNDDYQKFLNMTKEVALYDTGIEVTTADTIVTLSTCTSANDDHRFVVRGVKVKE